MNAFFEGMVISGSLIIAIGAQNAFLLKQALRRQYVFWACTVCFLCDVSLFSLSVLGLARVLEASRTLNIGLSLAGGCFLSYYGWRCARSAWRGGGQLVIGNGDGRPQTLGRVLLLTLAVSLLNPHAYLDAVVLIGGYSAKFTGPARTAFLMGSILSSALWFYGLGFFGQKISPYFQKEKTWRLLDGGIALFMWVLAVLIFRYALRLAGGG